MSAAARLFGSHADMVDDREFRLLLAANAIGALGTALVSPLLDTLTGPFGVSPAQIGLMVTAVAAPAVVLIPASGWLTDRIGRKPILLVGLLLFGGGGVGIAFTTNWELVLALRVVQGIGFAGVTPVIITCVGDLYSGDSEATAQGIRFSVSGLSQAVFPALAGVLVVFAWQYPFFLYAAALPAAIALYIWFEEPTADDAAIGDGGVEDEDHGGPDGNYVRELFGLARKPRVLAVLAARGIVVVPFIGFYTYNSLIVARVIGGTPRQAGVIVAVFSLVYALSATQAGRVTAAFEGRAPPLIVANLALGGGLCLFALAPSVSIAAVGAASLGIGVGLTFSLYRSIITGLAPTELRGGLVGLGESLGRLSVTFTPIGMGASIAALSGPYGTEAAITITVLAVGVGAAVFGALFVFLADQAAPAREADSSTL